MIRAVEDLNWKANSLFCVFRAADPFVKNSVFVFLCMVALFGLFHPPLSRLQK